MTYDYKSSCISRTGKIRNDNEDNFYFNGKSLPYVNSGIDKAIYAEGTSKDPKVIAVFDGMGGEIGGELAAVTGAETLKALVEKLTSKAVQPRKYLNESVQIMNEAVFRNSCEHGITRSGTTTAIFYFALDQFYICNVGDSRIYRYATGDLEILSEDDVIYNPNLKNQHLTQFLGVDSAQYSIKPHIKKGTISNNDLFLLCTDGLYNTVSEDEIRKIIDESHNDLTVCAERLADAAEKNGGDDNCTVILVYFTRQSWWERLTKHDGR